VLGAAGLAATFCSGGEAGVAADFSVSLFGALHEVSIMNSKRLATNKMFL
jgi:hypothetical protein